MFNYVNALQQAITEFGPHEIEPIKVVIVSHGPELVVFAKKNYEKYREIVDRASSLTKQGVKFEICRNAVAFLGFAPEDLHGFVSVVPPAPYALAYGNQKVTRSMRQARRCRRPRDLARDLFGHVARPALGSVETPRYGLGGRTRRRSTDGSPSRGRRALRPVSR